MIEIARARASGSFIKFASLRRGVGLRIEYVARACAHDAVSCRDSSFLGNDMFM